MNIHEVQTSLKELFTKSNFKTTSVIILCEEIQNSEHDQHVIDTTLALVKYGHRVIIFTKTWGIKRNSKKISSKLEIIKIGKFIPRSIFGYFQNLLHNLWSVYAALFTSIFKPKTKPNILFCDKNIMALPILNILGSYKIIQFHNFSNMDQENDKTKNLKQSPSWLKMQTITFVSEIILPNKASCHLFEQNYKKIGINKTILYPCVNNTSLSDSNKLHAVVPRAFLLRNIPNNNFVFVVLGAFLPISNFELAIEAIAILVRKVRSQQKTKIQLVIAGNFDKKSEDQYQYYSYLKLTIKHYSLNRNVTFIKLVPPSVKKSLLEYSIAMIQTSEYDIYNKNILEAMSLSKPVIATNTAFSLEVLEHGITGYVLPSEPIRFAEIMHEIIYNPNISKMVGKAAHDEYYSKYSFRRFSKDINKLVMKYCKNSLRDNCKLKLKNLGSHAMRNRDFIEEYMDMEISLDNSDFSRDFKDY